MANEVEADLDEEEQHSHPVVIALDDDINEEVEEFIQLSHKNLM